MDDSARSGSDRVPPGQYVSQKWPVLTHGETPKVDRRRLALRVFGLVEKEMVYDWPALERIAPVTVTADFHCVTRFSTLDNRWSGWSTRRLLAPVAVLPDASHVLVTCHGGYTTNLPLEDFLSERALLASQHNGEPLHSDHGGPLRLVVPHLYAWKSAKWVQAIELLDHDQRGFWEENGYHTYGDPWREQRFSAQETKEAYQVRRRARDLGLVPKG